MNTNDPIEDLFRDRSIETVGEKPRDLVWKRIESGLKDKEKKQKPMREFVSSIWFSAAVFALIAIPYFVLFIENLNSANNQEDSVEFVKTSLPVIENESSDQVEQIKNIEIQDKSIEEPIEIAKHNVVKEKPVYRIVEEKAAGGSIIEAEPVPSYSVASADAARVLAAPPAMEARSKVLDSIEKEGQFAKVSNQNLGILKDSVTKKASAPMSIRGAHSIKEDTSDVMKMKVVADEQSSNALLESVSVAEVSSKKVNVKKAEIDYKHAKFLVKSDILRTNFSLQNKSKSKVTFFNKEIVINFEKINGVIVFTTNEPKMDATFLGVLESNKEEIFNTYKIK